MGFLLLTVGILRKLFLCCVLMCVMRSHCDQTDSLLSLWLGAIEAQWFRRRPELKAKGPGRFPYSHCGWVSLRPGDYDIGQNWKPRIGEIPLLSLWLGASEAQWFRRRPELEARDRGDSPALTVIGRQWHTACRQCAVGAYLEARERADSHTLFEWSHRQSTRHSTWTQVLNDKHNSFHWPGKVLVVKKTSKV
jgi:hypothetical protein